MTSSYNDIYSIFLSKVTDYNFIELPDEDVYEYMKGWMRSTLSQPYIKRLFSSIVIDDEVMQIEFKLKNSVMENGEESADIDFVQEIISRGMVIEWLEPKVKSVINISQMFGGKEQKFYAQANHLSELKSMLSDAKTDLRKMIRDHGYINNSYVRGE